MALFEAIEKGDHKTLEVLLQLGVNVNQKSQDKGDTPLIRVSRINDRRRAPDLVKLLLGFGANIHMTDRFGRTAFHWVCLTANRSLFDLLVQSYTSRKGLNSADRNGLTPLFHAVESQKCSFVRHVVKTLADRCYQVLTRKNRQGRTASQVAYQQGHKSCSKFIDQIRTSLSKHNTFLDCDSTSSRTELPTLTSQVRPKRRTDETKHGSGAFKISTKKKEQKVVRFQEENVKNNEQPINEDNFLPPLQRLKNTPEVRTRDTKVHKDKVEVSPDLQVSVSYQDILPKLNAMFSLQQSINYRPGVTITESLEKSNLSRKEEKRRTSLSGKAKKRDKTKQVMKQKSKSLVRLDKKNITVNC